MPCSHNTGGDGLCRAEFGACVHPAECQRAFVSTGIKDTLSSLSRHADAVLIWVLCAAIYAPTYKLLDESIWVNVGQGHGPVMLALALWLAWDRRHKFMGLPGSSAPLLGWALMVFGALWFVVGYSQDMLALSVGSQLFIFAGLATLYRGVPGLKVMWFPLFFIIFLIPIPGSIVDQITAPLKMVVSVLAEYLLHLADYPIARSGVILVIGPYQLLVADACAGLNSLFALEAVGVFYMSLMRYKSTARNVALAVCILPISIVSNVIRVICLTLVTFYFGDEVGQSFVHGFAGILLFTLATLFTIGLDAVFSRFMSNERVPEDSPNQSLKEAFA
jgi:exosortase B